MGDSFDVFRTEHFKQWRIRLSKICFLSALIVFFSEVIIYMYYIYTNKLEETSILRYLLLNIVIPNVIIFPCLLIMVYIERRSTSSEKVKDYAVVFCVYVICSVVVIFHTYFNFLLLVVGIPIYLSAVFADKKLFKTVFAASIPILLLGILVMFIEKDGYSTAYRTATGVGCVLYMGVSYMIAIAILSIQEDSINYIYNSYLRQTKLIEELKIEPLTHLYNRTALDESIKVCVEKYKDGDIAPILVLLDLDHFKSVNDTYGHSYGDMVLIEFSNIIKKKLNTNRNSFRYGGEEFLIIFNECDEDSCYKTVQGILDDFSSINFSFAPDRKFTVSAGIVKYVKGWAVSEWFNQVDEAMYTSKKNGRNRITIRS